MATFVARELRDFLRTFEAGVNAGIAPELVPKNQMANAINTTVRGDFATVRPYFRQMFLDYRDNAVVQSLVETSLFQEACYYNPDNGPESIMAALAGSLIQFTIGTDRATVSNLTGGNGQLGTKRKHWMWQSEKWLIWNDGVSNPVFFDGSSTARSNANATANNSTTVATAYLIPAVGTPSALNVASTATMQVGTILTLIGFGQVTVTVLTDATHVDVLNSTAANVGKTVPLTNVVNFIGVTGAQLPPGRMGDYGRGRTWMSLPDGKQFVASDQVGGSSGTAANNYRDAVLNITENNFLAGGGNFSIPGSIGSIRAMRFSATLDSSLGQGPLQVFTANSAFSCQTPADRLTWQDVTNPILTESMKDGGSLSQDSTQPWNSDTMMRSKKGLQSLILGRREFATWGNTPNSLEVDPVLSQDDQNMLAFSSAVVFDNRYIVTTQGVDDAKGIYWRGIVPLNADAISTLRGKQPAVYDSVVWTGLNVLKLVVGEFNGVERAFAFTRNTKTGVLELWEILRTVRTELGQIPSVITDSGNRRVTWRIESSTLNFGQNDPRVRDLIALMNGEIFVDNLIGTVDFAVWYKPDQWPCWIPWNQWQECASFRGEGKPQFRPRMGLGEPTIVNCDPFTNRPMREFYTCQIAIEITGHCTFKGGLVYGVTRPQAPPSPVCMPLCP